MAHYNPSEIEAKWQKFWADNNIFKTETKSDKPNSILLWYLLVTQNNPMKSNWLNQLKTENLEATITYIDEVIMPLDRAKMTCPDAKQIIDEICWTAKLMKRGHVIS